MAATLTGKIQALLDLTYSNVVGLQNSSGNINRTPQIQWTSGVGANQIDKIYTAALTITASSNTDLDLAGSLVDIFGATITFARIKGLYIEADAANVNNVIVGNGGAGTNTWVGPFGAAAHTTNIRPGGILLLVAPDATAWAVTAGTGDLLRIANSSSGSSVLLNIILVGASA